MPDHWAPPRCSLIAIGVSMLQASQLVRQINEGRARRGRLHIGEMERGQDPFTILDGAGYWMRLPNRPRQHGSHAGKFAL